MPGVSEHAAPASVLAVDIGGTKIALRRAGGDAAPYDSVVRWPASSNRSTDVALLRDAVSAVTRDTVVGAVGISLPAGVDDAGTVTSWPNRPGWVGVSWSDLVASLFPGIPTATGDDGDLAALAEAEHAGRSDVLYLGVGTGIGGGIVSNGCLVPGRGLGSCEVGHLVVAIDGPLCRCGRRGCVQAIASGPAVLRSASESRGVDTTYQELREGWRAEADWADGALRSAGRALAAAVVGVGELLRVDLAVIGGGFAEGLPDLVDLVADRVSELSRPGYLVPEVRRAAYGGESSLHGALSLARSVWAEAATSWR